MVEFNGRIYQVNSVLQDSPSSFEAGLMKETIAEETDTQYIFFNGNFSIIITIFLAIKFPCFRI